MENKEVLNDADKNMEMWTPILMGMLNTNGMLKSKTDIRVYALGVAKEILTSNVGAYDDYKAKAKEGESPIVVAAKEVEKFMMEFCDDLPELYNYTEELEKMKAALKKGE